MGDFISEKDINNTDSFTFLSCEKTSGIPVENLHQENDRIFSFKAPYLRDNDEVNTVLHFKLTFKDKNDSSDRKITHDAKVIVKRVHRAMIFQGGVALGAYEAGVFQAVIEELVKIDGDRKRNGIEIEKRLLFDIVAGASIG
jgi:hypothetical protein